MKGEIVFPARVHLEDGTSRPETKEDRARRVALAKSLDCVATFRGTIEGSASKTGKVIDLLQNLSPDERARLAEVFK